MRCGRGPPQTPLEKPIAHPDPLVWIGGGPLRGERKGRGEKEQRLGDRRGGEKRTPK